MSEADIRVARGLYLDLLVKCIAGIIYKDPSIHPGGQPTFDPGVRHTGGDWPQLAHSMVGTLRLENVRTLTETILHENIPGDLIETGVWRGGSCILMRGILRAYGVRDRQIYVCDSFEGLPPPDDANYPSDAGLDLSKYPQLAVSVQEVTDNFRNYGLLDDQVSFVKGWFKDTLSHLEAERFALLRLDGDLYESTIQSLTALYPRLSVGGFIIIDDYGGLTACRRAVEDYRAEFGIDDPLQEIDWTGRWWRKSR
jgi:O-methyltransferase/8-demethyl-8-(2,3-dimethoxy-alpha-L-rhamnosyl)tetracenomycin-C 4'-O-methyltransferase